MSEPITVTALINAPIAKVWDCWSNPEHIVNWNFASDDWECPKASNDLRTGGSFSSVMRAKDGSASFEFGGVYTRVVDGELIQYELADGRKISVLFEEIDGKTHVTEVFDPENENPREMQQAGWQSILDNFRKYVQS